MTSTWLLILALAALPAAVPDDRAERERKHAKERAERAEKRAKEAEELAEKLAKRIRKGEERAGKETAEALKDFSDRIDDYLDVRKKAAEGLPPLNDDQHPVTIAARRVALARAIRARRAGARRGDIFDARVVPTIVARVRNELDGADAGPARKVLREGNPSFDVEGYVPVPVRINGTYPVNAPVSTVPASVLMVLPPLPEVLAYRFVGRDLILLDVEANLIVDFIVGAAPPLPAR